MTIEKSPESIAFLDSSLSLQESGRSEAIKKDQETQWIIQNRLEGLRLEVCVI